MPIVPITNDISIRTIRDVINQKAVILGQVRYRGTTYGLYGADQATGTVQTVLQNIQPTGNITLKVTLNRQGTEYGTQTLTYRQVKRKISILMDWQVRLVVLVKVILLIISLQVVIAVILIMT